MSGLVKGVKKIFKKVVNSDLFKAVATAAVIYFTVGTAVNYFGAAGGAGSVSWGSAAGETWSSMTSWMGTSASETVVADASVAPVTEKLAYMEANAPNVAAGEMSANEVVRQGSEVLANDAAAQAGAETAAQTAGETVTGSGFSGTGPENFSLTQEGGTIANNPLLQSGVEDTVADTGIMKWLGDNPMPAMLWGQGIMSAAAGYQADKEATRQARIESERLQNRGLMGFDHTGKRAGVVASQQVLPPKTQEQAVQEPVSPTVDAPTVTAPEAPIVAPQAPPPQQQQQQTPVPKDQLPQLLEQGRLA